MISQDDDSTHDSALGEPVLGLVGTAFDDVHLDRSAEDIAGRGRRLRRRRQAMPALATAGILAASLSIAAATQAGHTAGHNLAYNGAVVNVDEAGFSVHTDAKADTVTLIIHQNVLINADQLKQVLARADIPAVVRSDVMNNKVDTTCIWRGAKELDASKVINTRFTSETDSVTTIRRGAMPAGSVLGFEEVSMTLGVRIVKNGVAPTATAPGWAVGISLLSNMPTGCTK